MVGTVIDNDVLNELLSNSEWTLGPLMCCLRMTLDFRLLTSPKEDRRTSKDTAALSVVRFQYYTSVQLSSPYNTPLVALMTTPTIVQILIDPEDIQVFQKFTS